MTPFNIRWLFTSLPKPSATLPAQALERIKRLYFLDAGRRWGYVLRGWPLDAQNATLRLPGGQPFTYLEIEVVFQKFGARDAEAVGRVPAASIKRLDQTSPRSIRFPYRATIHVDLADLDQLLLDRAKFFDTIVHEIGHALGLGTSWNGDFGPKLARQTKEGIAFYVGAAGSREFALAKGRPYGSSLDIPLDTEVSGTTAAYHWSESALRFDIMSTSLDSPTVGNSRDLGSNVISRISAGALQDLGYLVDMRAAQPLPGS